MKKNKKLETNSIRAGSIRSDQGEHSEALYLTSSFVFKDAKEAAARFASENQGNVYSRFTNPSVKMFEDRLGGFCDLISTFPLSSTKENPPIFWKIRKV